MKNKIPFDIIADSALVFCCAIATVCVIPSAYSVPYSLGILILWALPTAFAICAALRKCETTWKVCLVSLGMTLVYGFLWRIRILYAVRLVRYSVFRLLALDFSFMPIPSLSAIAAVLSPASSAYQVFPGPWSPRRRQMRAVSSRRADIRR